MSLRVRRPDVRMWVPIGGTTVRLAFVDEPTLSSSIKLPVGEARWLAVVLAMLSGDWSPVCDLKRSLTIALVRRDSAVSTVTERWPARPLESLDEVTPVLDVAVRTVDAMTNGLAAEADVYALLHRLDCAVETAIAAADNVRNGSESVITEPRPGSAASSGGHAEAREPTR